MKARRAVRARRRESGVSLLGVVMSLGLIAALMAPIAGVLVSGKDSYARGACLVRLQENGRWVLERIEKDLRESRIDPGFVAAAPFGPGATADRIELNPRNPDDFDWDAGRVEWEKNETLGYALDIDSGEAKNGLDDDGDGLVDECRLVRSVEDASGETRSSDIARNVPADSLRFERPDTHTVRVSLLVSGLAEHSELITAQMTMDVYLRN